MAQELSQDILNLFNGDCCANEQNNATINPDPNTLVLRTAQGTVRGNNAINLLDLVTLQQLNQYIPSSVIGNPNGVAPLNGAGQIDPQFLPSYVDDVLEFPTTSSFPATGESGKIYIATSNNLSYRWSGSIYVEVSPSNPLTILQGGNGFSAPVVIGTNDLQPLHFKINGGTVAGLSANGFFFGTGMTNIASANNSWLNLSSNGTVISRNIADANHALIVNQANVSSTGNLQTWQFSGAQRATLTRFGELYTSNSIYSGGSIITNTNSVAPTHSITIPSIGTGIAQYNTSDQTTNYERVRQYWNGNVFNITSESGGTGTIRGLAIGVPGKVLNIYNTVSLPGIFNFNTNTGGTTSLLGVNGILTASSTFQNSFALLNTINQSGTAGYRGLWISPYEQSLGSGSKLLIDAGTNSAANGGGTHTSVFTVDNLGKLNIKTQVFADNAAAITGGLNVGDVYRTATGVLMIRF